MADNDTTQPAIGLVSSSDYKLSALTIVTSTGDAIDIRNIMLELNLYEDIFSPVMTGDVTVGDAGDIVSNYQLHGNEFILINIDKPTLNNPIKKVFRIYKIANRNLDGTSIQNYTIHFCSEELLLSTQFTISKSYKGLRIDQIVSDILNNKLQVNPNKISNGIFQQTTGVFDLIVPHLQPLEAIMWLMPRAFNTGQNLFLFFENRDGFNMTSYENLLTFPVYQTYTRSVKVTPEPDKNINTFNFIGVIEDFDLIKAMRNGSFSSSLLVLDLINKTFKPYNYNATQVPDAGLLNTNIPANGLQNRLGLSVYSTVDNMVKYVASCDADPTFNPARVKDWLPQTAVRLGQINSFKLVISIPGDIGIKAGAVVGITVPKMLIQDSATQNDPMRTGNYLVSGVHHRFIQDISTTILELLSDSVNTTLPSPAQSSDAVNGVLNY